MHVSLSTLSKKITKCISYTTRLSRNRFGIAKSVDMKDYGLIVV